MEAKNLSKQSIDYLIDKKVQKQQTFYLAKWTNQQHFNNSWVSLVYLDKQGFDELIQQYQQQNRQPESKQLKLKGRKQIHKPKKSSTRIVNIKNLKINIPTIHKSHPHWIFGDHTAQILSRDDQLAQYKVQWNNNKGITVVRESQLLTFEPLKVCQFFQKKLNILELIATRKLSKNQLMLPQKINLPVENKSKKKK